MITRTEQQLVELVSEAADKTRRGQTRLAEIVEAVQQHKDAVQAEAETLGKAQATAALEGQQQPDAKAARRRIEKHRTAVVELELEGAELRQQLIDIERAVAPHRERLRTARRRRAIEASGGYLEATMSDVIELLPRLGAALAIQHGEDISFYSSPDRICSAIQREIKDRLAFRASCATAHRHLLDTLKLD